MAVSFSYEDKKLEQSRQELYRHELRERKKQARRCKTPTTKGMIFRIFGFGFLILIFAPLFLKLVIFLSE